MAQRMIGHGSGSLQIGIISIVTQMYHTTYFDSLLVVTAEMMRRQADYVTYVVEGYPVLEFKVTGVFTESQDSFKMARSLIKVYRSRFRIA